MAIDSKMNRGPIGRASSGGSGKKNSGWIWIGVLILLAVLGGAWYYYSGGEVSAPEPIASGQYQAIFVDNGQVYFGELDMSGDGFYVLTDVFYLQSGGIAIDQTSNLALVKLGNEAHGPTDKMMINPEHILFIEDMKDDSKVVQAITQYKSSK